jgi:hypothetical protein
VSSSKIKIVFYDICGGATRFCSWAKADQAAQEYGRAVGYACAAFHCDQPHPTRNPTTPDSGPCWHVRGRRRPYVAFTGAPGRQFISWTDQKRIDAALAFDVDDLLAGIPD